MKSLKTKKRFVWLWNMHLAGMRKELIVQIAHKLFHSDLFARIVESPHSRLSEADARPIFAQMAEGNYVQFHSIHLSPTL